MKPLTLELQAFGPFAQRQTIDFRELGTKTFFLIHGPTGSGKTSILDGMCFALFGDSSGGERDGRQMRSHHADGDILTAVRFGFALGADRYRVRRVPEQMRKARRGGGETKQQPIAELSRVEVVDGVETERPLASGWSKVSDAVVGLLGFESAQFRQVIVLPQGKFFEFLKSSSHERERILQTLFGTELYKRIEDQLKLATTELARQADRVRMQRKALLDQSQADNDAVLDARLQQQTQALDERRGAERTTAAAASAAEQALAQARRNADRFEELDQAQASLQALRAQEPGWSVQRSRLVDARRALLIEPYAVALAALDVHLEEELRRAKTLAEQTAAATRAHDDAAAALDRERQRAPEVEQAIARIGQIDALSEKVAALAAARAAFAAAASQVGKATTSLAATRQQQTQSAEALQKLTGDIQEHRVQAAALDGLKARHGQLAAQLAQAASLALRLKEQAQALRLIETAQSRLKAADSACAAARQQLDRLRSAWVAGQAARLAHELVDGQACPVCGAHDHPAPARPTGEHVLDQTLKSAEEVVATAERDQRDAAQKLAAAQQTVSVLDARIAEVRTALGEAPASADELNSDTAATQLKLAQAEAAAKALLELEAKLPATRLAASNADAAAAISERAAQEAQAALQRLQGQLAEREAGIPPDLADAAALTAARSAAVNTRDRLHRALESATAALARAAGQVIESKTRLDACKQAASRLAAQRAERAADLAERLKAAGFADLHGYEAAHLGAPEMAALETGIAGFESSLAAAIERHSRAAGTTTDLVRPDLPGLTQQHENAKTALLAASNAVRDGLAAVGQTRGFVGSLRGLAGEYQTIEARFTVMKQVSDVAGGANLQRMSFQRYVLATLLEEVLAATTLRLRVMSRGRYEMRRKLQAADQRAAAGLDLEVFDQYTGTTRAVSTLSGGESFLASLALALGLSDVVQAYAGGIRLDAIFVDEGFGTLDPEALDFAVRALQDLQQAGRMVGIISHVAELKEWIDARLELKPTQTGSVAVFRF